MPIKQLSFLFPSNLEVAVSKCTHFLYFWLDHRLSVDVRKYNSIQPKQEGITFGNRATGLPDTHTSTWIKDFKIQSLFRNLRIYSSLKRAWMTNPTPPANPWSSNPTLFRSAPPWLAWAAEPWSTPCCRGSWMRCGLHSTVCPLCTSWAGQWAGQGCLSVIFWLYKRTIICTIMNNLCLNPGGQSPLSLQILWYDTKHQKFI